MRFIFLNLPQVLPSLKHTHTHSPPSRHVCLSVVMQSVGQVQLFATPWTAARQTSLSSSLPEFAQAHVHWVGDATQPSHPLHPLLLPSIFPNIRICSSELALRIRCPKYWSLSFSISPSIEYSRLISFRIDGFDLLTVHGTVKSLLQHRSLKASVLWRSAFFMVQLSHPYKIIEKT